MTVPDRIIAARALLETITPLKGDCGRRCGAACCQPDEDGQGGMLLFPGEAGLYTAQSDWYTLAESGLVIAGAPVLLFTCRGRCPRAERPLSCRIFPLTPVARDGQPDVRLDVRAWPVCPLMPSGTDGLARDFTAGVRAVAALLWEDAACRAYIEWLTGQQEAFSAL